MLFHRMYGGKYSYYFPHSHRHRRQRAFLCVPTELRTLHFSASVRTRVYPTVDESLTVPVHEAVLGIDVCMGGDFSEYRIKQQTCRSGQNPHS